MKTVRIDLGDKRYAEFELADDGSIIFAKFVQGITEMDVTKFSELFDLNIIKMKYEHSQTKL